MRSISLRGCKKLSSSLNGEIFQLSEDEMIKVYPSSVSLEDIKKEREYTQAAMALGIPTLIPYDVVNTEHGHGIVFEKAEMKSLAYLISHNKDSLEMYATMLGNLLKELLPPLFPRLWIRLSFLLYRQSFARCFRTK